MITCSILTCSIAYFLPTILEKSIGFSVAKTQCLVAPPWAGTAVVMFFQAIYSDKWHVHGSVLAGNVVVELVGFGMLGYLEHPAPNIHGRWKRAFTSIHSSAKAVSETLLE
ncbi:unnamed protein product [Penicillium palitans]